MSIVVPSGNFYPDDNGSINASDLGLPGDQMYSYASTDVEFAAYVIKHFLYQTCAMGDELNAEGAQIAPIPVGWKVRILIVTTDSDSTSKGFASFEMYRARSVILP